MDRESFGSDLMKMEEESRSDELLYGGANSCGVLRHGD